MNLKQRELQLKERETIVELIFCFDVGESEGWEEKIIKRESGRNM